MKTYIRDKVAVKAKLFEQGDEDGWVKDVDGNKIPFVRTLNGNTYAEFGSHYYVVEPNGDKLLVSKDRFNWEYSEIPNY